MTHSAAPLLAAAVWRRLPALQSCRLPSVLAFLAALALARLSLFLCARRWLFTCVASCLCFYTLLLDSADPFFPASPFLPATVRRQFPVLWLLPVSCRNYVFLSASAFARRRSAPWLGASARCCSSCRLPILFGVLPTLGGYKHA